MADLNDDGRDDVISGSYWPGDLYVFFGEGNGKFAAGEMLKDPRGKNASAGEPWNNPEAPDHDSLATAPRVVDWDCDGDLDLVVGNVLGHVVLLLNEGGPKAPKFVRKGPIRAGGDVLKVDDADAGPAIGDWDRDGLWDLIVGGGAGSVVFFRNVGRIGAPRFGTGVEIVEGGRGKTGGEPQDPGVRCKPQVADWNGDGALDLLVGDLAPTAGPRRELTPEQRVSKRHLEGERAGLMATIERLKRKCDDDLARLGADDRKLHDAARKRCGEVATELEPLTPRKGSGFVWVYLRKP